MRVFGITGWKNSGKTGLMERLVTEFTRVGYRVSTLKHAHHDADVDEPGRDSYRHRAAGAEEVLLSTSQRWALMHELRGAAEPSLADHLARLAPVDIVLVEGWKRDAHPKIECHRAETGNPLIQPGDSTIRAVASDSLPPGSLAVPVLDLDDTAAIAALILRETEPQTTPALSPPFPSQRSIRRLRFGDDQVSEGERVLPAETAVALSYNGSTQAVMMATPEDLHDFALGYSLTEGIARPAEIERIEAVATSRGIDLQIWLAPGAEARQVARRRQSFGPMGCGLCGIESLEEVLRDVPRVATPPWTVRAEDIAPAVAGIGAQQRLRAQSGALHAAAFWQPARGIVMVREDVGRHNALDKLCGALKTANMDPASGGVVMTSRLSIDLVQKCAMLGAPLLIAVSAPTAEAVALAERSGITLITLAGAAGCDVWSHPGRVTEPALPDPLR
ncbi:formate dehydrogenase accessory sulfurtransferase FdhD [Haematobacter genomosp. 1]|uniref:Sulfur carrier protein FdhD n=1 Tax=Haematobacter genomosp. 1 TaxID=366618 RepID=A0A212AFB0_9RHOB|nr:formate dehydrogenase accessory sulfurtransferase FdhD [Haematobacter genomosp. 1]OWJ80167.1 hypothetical protein CDV49_02480 [Haematobacter genomosp. 1]